MSYTLIHFALDLLATISLSAHCTVKQRHQLLTSTRAGPAAALTASHVVANRISSLPPRKSPTAASLADRLDLKTSTASTTCKPTTISDRRWSIVQPGWLETAKVSKDGSTYAAS